MIRWSDEKTLAFIKCYKECDSLWNEADPLHRNKGVRRSAYMYIMHQLYDDKLTVGAVRERIHNLKAAYNVELKKIKESKQSGDPSLVYKPSGAWFDLWHSFFGEKIDEPKESVADPQKGPAETSNPQILPKPMDTPVMLLPNTSQNKTNAAVNNIKLILVPQNTNNNKETTGITPTKHVKKIVINIPPQPGNNNQEGTVTNQKYQVINSPSNAKKRLLDANESVTKQIQAANCPPWAAKNRQIDTTEPELSGVLDRLEDISALVNAPREDEDEFHYYGMNVAAQLRRLPLNVALQMQAEFQNSLFIARVRYQNGGTSTAVSGAAFSPPTNEVQIDPYVETVKEETEELPQTDIQQRIEFESDLSDESEVNSETED